MVKDILEFDPTCPSVGFLQLRWAVEMSAYRELVVETYRNYGEPSGSSVRVRPVEGQGISTTMSVECSKSMRSAHPLGTKFLIRCKITNREDGSPFLYSSWQWKYKVLTDAETESYVRSGVDRRA